MMSNKCEVLWGLDEADLSEARELSCVDNDRSWEEIQRSIRPQDKLV